ncbi:MAG TPA: 1-phosphofructokinase [Thermoanaerobaculia bacterium]|nr:1-phosphofructokinase [Thermoanaerobaculia bacterium]
MSPVVTVTLNPAIDQTLTVPGFAAGRVNRVAASRCDAGGKGVNVASVLAGLGVETIATGFLGADNAAFFATFFERKGIADRFVRIAGATRTGIKIVNDSTRETTDVNFPGLTPMREDAAELFARISALAAPDRWFVLSGSVPAGIEDGVYARMIDAIHARGGKVVLDTSGRPLATALASRPEVMKPNVDELSELASQELATPAAVRGAAATLLAHGVELVVVSMGGEGAVFVNREQSLLARPPKVAVRSTVGAGDAMVAGLVSAMIQGLPLADVARTATACGAYAVTRVGSGIDDLGEVRRLMGEVEIEGLT